MLNSTPVPKLKAPSSTMKSKTVPADSPSVEGKLGLQKGWRAGISRGIALTFLVFVINLVCTIYAVLRDPHDVGIGQRIVFEGNCEKVKNLEIYLHLVINILSTIVLGASNYTMQCLTAPTRHEVDNAHQQRIWLDIGVLSLRNLGRIGRKRVLLWVLLGLSSMPLHLFYNSAIYASTYSADYMVFMTTEDYLVSNATSHTLGINTTNTDEDSPDQPSFNDLWVGNIVADNYSIADLSSRLYASAMAKTLTRLNTTECMNFYATTFPTNQGSVILVTSDATNTPRMRGYPSMDPITNLYDACPPDPFTWMCNEIPTNDDSCRKTPTCSQKRLQLDPNNWRPLDNKVDYCLSQNVDQKCFLALNLPLAIVVMAFNVLKCGSLICALWIIKDNPLMTLGDAIASFLEQRDDTTQNMCLLSKSDLETWGNSLPHENPPLPKNIDTTKRRWNSVVGTARWRFLLILYFIVIGVSLALFFYGIIGRPESAATLMKISLGTTDPRAFIEGWAVPSFGVAGLLSNVLVANSPQLMLSMIYFTYNSLFTTFMLGVEWNSFSSQRKSLRVSEYPTGDQRATHFLQLPFRWAIPLMTLSAVLHWLCSQSIFLVGIEFDHTNFPVRYGDGSLSGRCSGASPDIGTDGSECYDQYFTCGYSPLAILLTVILGIGMIVFAALIGLRRYENGSIPIVGSCSAAISASCHMLDEDKSGEGNATGAQAATSSLQWGEFDTRLLPVNAPHAVEVESDEHEDTSKVVYHCGFSHHEVGVPDESRLYA